MPDLTDLPGELISWIGEYLEAKDVGSLRLTSKDLCGKMSYRFSFLFKTVKVSLIGVSIQALINITRSTDVAKRVEHLIIGTETLKEYEKAPMSNSDEFHRMLLKDGNGGTLRSVLRKLIVSRLHNLKTITIEDRPAMPASEFYRSSMGTEKMKRTTGVNLRWNGPYTIDGPSFPLPLTHRIAAYDGVFNLLRQLDTHGRVLNLIIIRKGFPSAHLYSRGWLMWTFDLTDASTRNVLDSHLIHLEVGEKDFKCWLGSSIEEEKRYVISHGVPFIYWDANGRRRLEWGRDGQMKAIHHAR